MASTTDMTNMKAVVIPPMKEDKSIPVDLKAFPVSVWSKLFSIPIFSTILFTVLPTNFPIIYPRIRTIMDAIIAGKAPIISELKSVNNSPRSVIITLIVISAIELKILALQLIWKLDHQITKSKVFINF